MFELIISLIDAANWFSVSEGTNVGSFVVMLLYHNLLQCLGRTLGNLHNQILEEGTSTVSHLLTSGSYGFGGLDLKTSIACFVENKGANHPNYMPFFFFRLSASALGNGKPLVRLSAPVLLEIRAFSPPNSRHHVPNADKAALPMKPSRKPICAVPLYLVQQ